MYSHQRIQTIVTEKKPWTYEFMAHGEVSEDCLYVNVWTPSPGANAGRPVFAYIYGGGNVEGSGSIPSYDGEGLASKGLVVVTFNYRVGVLGFLSHPELNKESSYHASGNYGLLDQIAAVRWVHDNIAAFGGDPKRVTVAGQSAGASAVHSLTASPLARGLFQRAIADSGAGVGGMRAMADQEADGVRFAEAKKARSIAELRAMAWTDVVTPFGRAFRPVPDGYALQSPVRRSQRALRTMSRRGRRERGRRRASPHPATTLEASARRGRTARWPPSSWALPAPATTGPRAQDDAPATCARDALSLALDSAKTAKTPRHLLWITHAGPDADSTARSHVGNAVR